MHTTHHQQTITVLIAEDDDGHADLIRFAFEEAGLKNQILRFKDGQEILDFLFQRGPGPKREDGSQYLLLLDIRMPKMDGVQVLGAIKKNSVLKDLPVIMLTTTDDPREIQTCYQLGCNCYVTKPVDFKAFSSSLKQVGLFLMVVSVPRISHETR